MSGHRQHPSGSVCNVFQSPKRVQSSGHWKRLVAAVDGVTHVVRFTMVPCWWNFFPSPPSLLSLKSMHVQPKFRICPPIYLFFQSFSWSLFVLDNFFLISFIWCSFFWLLFFFLSFSWFVFYFNFFPYFINFLSNFSSHSFNCLFYNFLKFVSIMSSTFYFIDIFIQFWSSFF
jgi:hypothetical protein